MNAIDTGTAALVVIDVQRGLFDTRPPPFEADAVVARINGLADRARAAGAPVVFVQHERDGSPLAFGSNGWSLESSLRQSPRDYVVRKTTPDAFLRTGLADLLQALAVDRLVLCGYASEFCVDTTARRAAALGFPVTLAADAHTTHDKPHLDAARIRAHHNATLPDISSFGVEIRAVDSDAIEFSRAG
ncbi:cysteine hydrolase family protein [Montanilutibacter psychrotolerans]|uniref:Cysteine hydrolase n=1 Tax=Montanilutibacter psychrotolerans TaxID=1327343 RepID=A0A3M8SWV9_9GAMM|nr:cysteine hydrolase family protein [Lysobacter psychrotolerans]RNF83704.1 cysteine hydrolase [Lysobacter psychrotolerans]